MEHTCFGVEGSRKEVVKDEEKNTMVGADQLNTMRQEFSAMQEKIAAQ